MKKYSHFIIFSGIVIFGLISAGCIYPATNTGSPTLSNQDAILKDYISAFNNDDGQKVYDMLSSKVQSQQGEDKIHNTVHAYKMQGLILSDYTITSEATIGDTVRIKVDTITMNNGYQKTEHKIVDFVNENGKWKLNNLFPISNPAGTQPKNIAITAQKQGENIVITNNGGPDVGMLSNFAIIVDKKPTNIKLDKIVGSSITVPGQVNSKTHIVVTAWFNDGSQQDVLDTNV